MALPIRTFRVFWRICRTNVDAGLVGPLFFTDLARLARRGRTTLLRCAYALVLLGLLCFLVLDSFPNQYRQLLFEDGISLTISQWAGFSRTYAVAILSVQAAAILVLTPAYLGSAIAEEKERHTADLLLTTRLSDRQFVLGKLFGRLTHLATVLLAGLPILCLTRLWGGIDDNLLVAGFAVALLSLLSSGGISILCSVLAPRVLGAVIAAYLSVFLLNAACLALPATSPVLFVAAWDQQVESEWQEWQDQVDSTRRFLGNSSLLATIPPPPTPNSTRILAFMLAPFALVHLSIFFICTIATIQVVRAHLLSPGVPIRAGLSTEARISPRLDKGESISPPLGKGGLGGSQSRHEIGSDVSEDLSEEMQAAELGVGRGGRPPQPPLAKGGSRGGAKGGSKETDHRRSRTTSQLLEPVGDPALLWKEIYQAAAAGPGPGLQVWRTVLWRPTIFLLCGIGVASGVLLWRSPEVWRYTMTTLNLLLAALTVLLATFTSGLLAFRSGASVCGERERQTLDALLALPVERREILQAKWLGTFMRYRLCIYGLLTMWCLGLVTGAIHPLAVVLLIIVCGAHFAFLISLGLWLSMVSRTTLWAHMRLATIFLVFFCGAFLESLDSQLQHGPDDIGLATRMLGIGLIPERSWWFTSFGWVDASGKLTANGPESWHAIVDIGAGTLLFGGAAWLFWWLACRRWDETVIPKKCRLQSCPVGAKHDSPGQRPGEAIVYNKP